MSQEYKCKVRYLADAHGNPRTQRAKAGGL